MVAVVISFCLSFRERASRFLIGQIREVMREELGMYLELVQLQSLRNTSLTFDTNCNFWEFLNSPSGLIIL